MRALLNDFARRYLAPTGERLLGIDRIRRIYRELPAKAQSADFARLGLESLGVRFDVDGVVLIANHPFGAIEGLYLLWLARQRRRDVRALANTWLGELPAIADLMLPVDPFGGATATSRNAGSLRRALRWAEQGGALIIFPAGEVSHLQPQHGCVMDPDWSPTACRLIRRTGVPVVPVHFSGQNSAAFQVAGLVHERMRTALLAHEALNKRGQRIRVRVGSLIEPQRMTAIADDGDLARYLRMRTYALADSDSRLSEPVPHPSPAAIAPERPASELLEELPSLGTAALLHTAKDMSVYSATGARIPLLLQEIGRLREQTFRAAGEGTGRAIDVDLYDDYYEHIFLWSHADKRLIGAYRIGRADRILARFGLRGLYTSTLFEFRRDFMRHLGPALELGRSFVRLENQKEYGPLHLLWKGIGEYVRRDSRYRLLFGAASISNDYSRASQALLVQYLRHRHGERRLARSVRARHGVEQAAELRPLLADLRRCRNLDEVSALVADLEPDGKGMPVLIRQYLRLGGRILGFNRDPAFSDAIDCLLLVDLKDAAPQLLQRYVGEEAAASIRGMSPAAENSRRRQA